MTHQTPVEFIESCIASGLDVDLVPRIERQIRLWARLGFSSRELRVFHQIPGADGWGGEFGFDIYVVPAAMLELAGQENGS